MPWASLTPRRGPGPSVPSPTSPLQGGAARGTCVSVLLQAAGEAAPAQLLRPQEETCLPSEFPTGSTYPSAGLPSLRQCSLLSSLAPRPFPHTPTVHSACPACKGPLHASLLLSPKVHLQTHRLRGVRHDLPPPTPAAPAAQHALGHRVHHVGITLPRWTHGLGSGFQGAPIVSPARLRGPGARGPCLPGPLRPLRSPLGISSGLGALSAWREGLG